MEFNYILFDDTLLLIHFIRFALEENVSVAGLCGVCITPKNRPFGRLIVGNVHAIRLRNEINSRFILCVIRCVLVAMLQRMVFSAVVVDPSVLATTLQLYCVHSRYITGHIRCCCSR